VTGAYTGHVQRARTARNIAIVLLIAAAVYALPGGRAANIFESVLLIGFGVGIGYLGLRLYRENRVALYGLGDRYRGLLYGGLALGMFLIVAQKRMWQSGIGELAWFVLAGLVIYAMVAVYRYSRSY
jgi:hypothetical protein